MCVLILLPSVHYPCTAHRRRILGVWGLTPQISAKRGVLTLRESQNGLTPQGQTVAPSICLYQFYMHVNSDAGNTFLNLCVANPILQTYVANGGGRKRPQQYRNISAAIQDRDKISMATPPFS